MGKIGVIEFCLRQFRLPSIALAAKVSNDDYVAQYAADSATIAGQLTFSEETGWLCSERMVKRADAIAGCCASILRRKPIGGHQLHLQW